MRETFSNQQLLIDWVAITTTLYSHLVPNRIQRKQVDNFEKTRRQLLNLIPGIKLVQFDLCEMLERAELLALKRGHLNVVDRSIAVDQRLVQDVHPAVAGWSEIQIQCTATLIGA